MEWSSLLGGPVRELAMYPDTKVYRAAMMLPQSYRPGPIKMVANDWKGRPTNAWVDQLDRGHVNVSSTSPIYQKGDFDRLAASLAHEAIHQTGDTSEQRAYDREAEVLRMLGEKRNRKRLADIETLRERYK